MVKLYSIEWYDPKGPHGNSEFRWDGGLRALHESCIDAFVDGKILAGEVEEETDLWETTGATCAHCRQV